MYRGLVSSHRDNLPVANLAAAQVLCLPIYPDLALETVEEICKFIGQQ
jgi:dTDP-4-amino-4,6-dideoxygalactose transaminase